MGNCWKNYRKMYYVITETGKRHYQWVHKDSVIRFRKRGWRTVRKVTK